MNILFDMRCNHFTGIFNYGIQLLSELILYKETEIRIFVVCYHFQKKIIENLFIEKVDYILSVCFEENNDICKKKIHTLIKREHISLYLNPNYQIEKNLEVPYVLGIHDLIKYNDPLFFPNNSEYFNFRKNMRQACRGAKCILTNSSMTKQIISQEFGIDFDQIYIFTPRVKEIFKKNFFSEKQMCKILKKYNLIGDFSMYVGLAHHHKRVDFIIKAYSEIAEQIPLNSKLLLVSDPIMIDSFLCRMDLYHRVKDRIVCLHDVSDDELAMLYRKACALCNASTIEGYGIPIAEALTSGCPVLAPEIPIFREEYGNCLNYYQMEDIEGLKHLMKKAYNRELPCFDWKQSISTEGIKFIEWCNNYVIL